MEIRNCVRCGKLFRFMGLLHCPQCREELDQEFQKVRNYLREHPNARVFEVAEATGVSVWQIHEFVRSGKLVAISPESDLAVTCVECGTTITTGRLCARCGKTPGRPGSSARPGPNDAKGRLHIENRLRRRSRD